MALADIRKNVTESTPLLAVVGATDYAVERVRHAAATASGLHLQEEVEKTLAALETALETVPATVQAQVRKFDAKTVQQVPAIAVARALEAAGKVESSYEQLAVRGKELLDRVSQQKATQDLIKQGKATVTRTRAAVTTARKAVDETTAAARGVVTIGRREAVESVADVESSVAETEKVVAERGKVARAAVKGATSTARRRVGTTRSAVKGASTSAHKTMAKAVDAAEATAKKVGEDRSDA